MRTIDQVELSVGRTQAEQQISPVILNVAESLVRVHRKPRKFVSLETTDTHHIPEGLYMLPNWEGSDLLRIKPHRDYRVLFTRGVSAHDVSFGLAELRTPDGLKTIAVAIKPFNKAENGPDKNAMKAMEDAIVNAWVLRRGFTTTDPIAVIRSQDSFIVSPVKPGVQALDTEPWHQFGTTQDLTARDHFVQRLRQVAEILARLNFRGINQVDSQLRNYWMTPEGMMEPFDWESAKIVEDPPSAERFLQIAAETLRPLFKNLQQGNKSPRLPDSALIPILRGNPNVIWDQFIQLVLEPYIAKSEDLFLESGNDELLDKVTVETITAALKEHLGQRD